ncbi:xanthine dehydrogenase family protein molybdopterin-binding subunit [Alteromonas sp. ASW11-19]|uniref:Xanthine dehydrogenase family protein molybdopterin-binding subunit n=1 Tax=Alteromonas salexigens TaxID=2982530 RepID=A0ABT2VKX4_9ALTE|nr:xanthine dehydrogenase family protein molybdopterin-binding subunit [Alteromonas salexigens]MCU7553463.1 xanthine dehydrogenase family protein molybdopterin-binding subunit [Alteromonas salexigens]
MPANVTHKSQGIGAAMNRVDGRLKVTGKANYAGDSQFASPPLIGWVVGADVASGTLTHLDTSGAESQEGVHAVITHLNSVEQAPFGSPEDMGRFGQSRAMLNDTTIRYAGFPIAMVVADTLEQARYAAQLIEFTITPAPISLLSEHQEAQVVPEDDDGGYDPDAGIGNIDAALADHQRFDMTYTTPNQVSAAMEPHTCIASYDGEQLEVQASVQILASAVDCLASTFKLPADKIRIKSPYVGGGFGSKLGLHNDAILACIGALQLQRPVKVAMTRRQVFHNAPHRGKSIQHMALSVTDEGQLAGVRHHSAMPMAKDYAFAEGTGVAARINYQAAAIDSQHRVKVVDSPMIDSVRAPGDAIGSLAFESAVDELARTLDIDPVTFRRNNIAPVHPITGADFSTNNLDRCLQEGAAQFGWDERTYRTRGTRKNGFGVALGMRMNMIVPSEASLTLHPNGELVVHTDMTDIGTGTYTILTQIVAEHLKVDANRITIDLGDSNSPTSSGSGGSFGASSAGTAVLNACEALSEKLCELAGLARGNSLVQLAGDNVIFGEGQTQQQHAVPHLLNSDSPLTVTGSVAPDEGNDEYVQYSSAAHFAEVEVDTITGEVRILRQHGAFSAGRILNRKTAGSQLKGGMIWGASYALLEDLQQDPRDGSFVNCDFAEYHIAVNRDIGDITLQLIEEPDYKACKLGSKGIGELGITGSGAAIANAVFDAVGVRVRDFPITPDKIVKQLSETR